MLKSYFVFIFRWGNSPLDEAQTFGRNEIVDFLKNWEIDHAADSKTTEEKSVEQDVILPL